MDLVPLPRGTTLTVDAGSWILISRGAANGSDDGESTQAPIRIGPATGTNALNEIEARQLARRYLLTRLTASVVAERSQMTVTEFIRKHFLPELLVRKRLPWRAHYHSILKHILSPEDCESVFEVPAEAARTNRGRDAHLPFLGQLRLRDVRPLHVHQLIEAALETGYSPQTARQVRSLISAVFSYARQELMFTGINPARAVKAPDNREKRSGVLTLEQMEQVLGVMRYPEKQITAIRLLTDMNVSEICGLQWKRVNLTGSWSNSDGEVIPPITISVRKRWYRGELADVMSVRLRKIPIPQTLLPMLLLLRANSNFADVEDFVLTSRAGTAINISNITSRRMGAISKTLGIPQLTLQALRRSQALVKGDLGPRLQRFLGAALNSEHLP